MSTIDLVTGEIFSIDKPLGWTSFDAVKRLRGAVQRRLGVRKFKVGHAGTLDPLASGVLLVCTGKATKRIEELQAGEKEYIATICIGATTPSFDLETEIDGRFPVSHIDRQLIDSVMDRFRGHIMQIPPIYSAVKVEGKRAYDLARRGHDVELKAKPLEIKELEVLDFTPGSDTHSLTLRIVCGKGTYIRAMARDIGTALGSGAHLTALRRTRVGQYTADNSLSLDLAIALIASAELSFPEDYKRPESN